MVRILRLGTSDDQNPSVPEHDRAPAVCERTFSEAVGESAETAIRRIVPNLDAPEVVERWLARYEPDCVVLVISSVWCSYKTAAYRMQSTWPRPVQPLANAVQRWGGRTASSNGLVLQAGRKVARRLVGVSARFLPDDVVSVTEACIRTILRHEDIVLVVRGPVTRYPGDGSDHARLRLEKLRSQVEDGLDTACKTLHVEYLARDPKAPQRDDELFLPDGVHCNAVEHGRRGTREGAALAAAWQRVNSRPRATSR
ncbi:MAG: hypothetical protein ACRDG3_10610 [Tepidiformaceae bacterium]